MGQIDKTRDNLKVESLEDNLRKDLYKKFVKAGGQVIKENPRRAIKIDREKQKALSKRLDDHQKNIKDRPSTFVTSAKNQSTGSFERSNTQNGFHLLFTRFKLATLGIAKFNGKYFKKKFFENFKNDYNPAMIELQMIYLDLFKQRPMIGHQIIDQLDEMRPLYYELVEMAGDIYDAQLISKFIDNYTISPDSRHSISEYRNTILAFFKKLYVLNNHIDTIHYAFYKSLDLQERMERGKASLYAAKRKKVKNSLFILFNKFLPRLYWLFCLIQGEIIELTNTKRIDELLNISQQMKPGTRASKQSVSKNSPFDSISQDSTPADEEPIVQSSEPEKPKTQISDEVKKGLSLMDSVDFVGLRRELIKDDLIRNVSETDKIMKAYLLFIEFDKEYSFILTTYKIKFLPAYSIRGKSDYRMQLSDIYNKMRICFDALKEYFISLDIYEKARTDRPVSNEQYFKYTKRLAEHDHEKKQKGRLARMVIREYMDAIIEEMSKLIYDMDIKHEIILNPQDMIEFDSALETNRKMMGKKIYEVILSVHAFASAFSYRLSSDGDLSGENDFPDNTPNAVAQNTSVSDQPQPVVKIIPAKSEPETKPDTNNGDEKNTILGELDDFV
jgi:hypothetical protein